MAASPRFRTVLMTLFVLFGMLFATTQTAHAEPNLPPQCTVPIPNQIISVGSAYTYTVPVGTFTGWPHDYVIFSSRFNNSTTFPAWLQFTPGAPGNQVANRSAGRYTVIGTAVAGTYDIRTIATDDDGPGTCRWTLEVRGANVPPTVTNPMTDKTATEDSLFTYAVPSTTFTDANSWDILPLTAFWMVNNVQTTLPTWLSFASTSSASSKGTGQFSGTPTNADVGSYTIRVVATDDAGATASSDFVLTVGNVNDAPVLANPILDQNATEDQFFRFTIPANTFSDVDAGDTLTYSTSVLPGWLSFDPFSREFTGTPANSAVGTLVVEVTVMDSANATATDSFAITVANVNDAPTVANPISDQNATEDVPYAFAFAANTFADVDAGDSLTYSAVTPGWLSFDAPTRTFTGTPTNDQVGPVEIQVTATDLSGEFVTDRFILTVANINDAPQLALPAEDQSTTEDEPFSYTLPAGMFTDMDPGDSLSYSTSTLPAWLIFNPATGAFTGTPTNADVGWFDVTVTATDSGNATATDNFRITVTNVNDTPYLAHPIDDQQATEDAAFHFTFPADTFADDDASTTLTYSTAALPDWLSFDPATRAFSGTPANADVGLVTVHLTASDGLQTATDIFTIDVQNTNDAPTLASPLPAQIDTLEDAPFSYFVPSSTFADVDAGDSLTLSLTGPAWLTLTGSEITGAPTNDQVGDTTVTVVATDSEGATASASFILRVINTNDTPVLAAPLADQQTEQGDAFSYAIPAGSFIDVDAGDELTYTATLADDSDLPAWLSFDPLTQTFSGTPGNADIGTLTIQVTASDGEASAEDSFDLTIDNLNDAPTVANPLADPIEALEDAPFNLLIPANTFADPDAGDNLTLSLTGPAWLTLNENSLEGTPANADVGEALVTITATDTEGAHVSSSFTLRVTNVNDTPELVTPLTDQDATEDLPFTLTLPAGTFSDVDAGDSLALTATRTDGSDLPAWLSFEAASLTFSGTPANEDVGVITVKVTATDLAGAHADAEFGLTVANVNDAPTVDAGIADQQAYQDALFQFTFAADAFADVDAGDTLTYAATLAGGSPLPAWLNFDPATRTFSGTPANGDVASLTVQVTATDGEAEASLTFDLAVLNVNDPPALAASLSDQDANEDEPFSFSFAADAFSDPDPAEVLTYTAELSNGSPLPAWLHFAPATRTFSGAPTQAEVGAYEIRVLATDPSAAYASDVFNLTVHNVNDAPQSFSIKVGEQRVQVYHAYDFTVPPDTFVDEDPGDSLTCAATLTGGAGLPYWLSFDPATMRFTGTPAHRDRGIHGVRITCQDAAHQSAFLDFEIEVWDIQMYFFLPMLTR